jgi:hypothetical protein
MKAGPTRAIGAVAMLLLLQGILVAAFVLPAHKPEPHDVPIGVVGHSTLVQALEQRQPGGWDVEQYASEAAARSAIEHRDVYAAAVGEDRLLVASAASATVATLLKSAASAAPGMTVTELKPLAEGDPRGSILNTLFLPLLMGASLTVMLLGPASRKLVAATAVFSALASVAIVGFVGSGLDGLPGPFWTLSAVTALVILAVTLPTAGFMRLFGQKGASAVAAFFVLLANPASGNGSAPELLPGFWRAIGQFMPPGAGGTSLRNVAYFDGNATLRPLLVLAGWALFGAALVFAAEVRRRRAGRDRAGDEPVELKRAA